MVAWYWHAHGWGPGLWLWISWMVLFWGATAGERPDAPAQRDPPMCNGRVAQC